MLSRSLRALLCLGGVIATACSDSPTSTSVVDTTKTTVNTSSNVCTSPLSMTIGQVNAGVTGTSICVGGGTSGAEFALIPYYGTTNSNATTNVDFTATGTSTPSAAPSLSPAASATLDVSGSGLSLAKSPYQPSHAFELKLR